MNRVYNLSRVNSPLKILRRRQPATELSPVKISNTKKIKKNQSLLFIEKILRLPKMDKEYKMNIEETDFVIQYFQNKSRVELTYRQKYPLEPIEQKAAAGVDS
jgi:hypothetical protein